MSSFSRESLSPHVAALRCDDERIVGSSDRHQAIAPGITVHAA
ncbi:MAG TPA: hypothetical protein VER33_25990 [Polyangiaceae bacterium]|nr:hypothetical protein [Polyangiaceae bacterium]